jgi:hypothetical protein
VKNHLRGFDLFKCSQVKNYKREDFIVKNEVTKETIIPDLKLTIPKKGESKSSIVAFEV